MEASYRDSLETEYKRDREVNGKKQTDDFRYWQLLSILLNLLVTWPSHIDSILQKSSFQHIESNTHFFTLFICTNAIISISSNARGNHCQQLILENMCSSLQLCQTIDLTWIVFMAFLNKVNSIHPRHLNIANRKEEKSTLPMTNRIMNASNLMSVISSFQKKITPESSLLRAYFFPHILMNVNTHL